jgi:hypothetical protein
VYALTQAAKRRAQEESHANARTSRELQDRLGEVAAREKQHDSLLAKLNQAIEVARGQRDALKAAAEQADVLRAERDRLTKKCGDLEQSELEVEEVAKLYLNGQIKLVGEKLTSSNYSSNREKLEKAIERLRKLGIGFSRAEERQIMDDLKSEYEEVVRKQLKKEEQARIKERLRDEQRAEAEYERELARIQNEERAILEAIRQERARSQQEHSAELARLEARLAEAQAKERAVSQAQLTKAGNVYVISNIGSFGEDVFKVGMTRRREPLDRVRELGDASVPFPFDVHMMIWAENAPGLEHALHEGLRRTRLNRVNPRKEFFRCSLDRILQIVEEHHGKVEYVADAEALEYRESLAATDEDLEVIEAAWDDAETALK